LPHLYAADNGRVLGYDNAHVVHERHHEGKVSPVPFNSYAETSELFYREVKAMRRSYED
jgi:hypothetical protein